MEKPQSGVPAVPSAAAAPPMQAVAVLLLCRSGCFLGSGAGLKVFIHQEWLEKTLLSWWLIWDDSPPYQKEKDKSRWCFCGGKKHQAESILTVLYAKRRPGNVEPRRIWFLFIVSAQDHMSKESLGWLNLTDLRIWKNCAMIAKSQRLRLELYQTETKQVNLTSNRQTPIAHNYIIYRHRWKQAQHHSLPTLTWMHLAWMLSDSRRS